MCCCVLDTSLATHLLSPTSFSNQDQVQLPTGVAGSHIGWYHLPAASCPVAPLMLRDDLLPGNPLGTINSDGGMGTAAYL